MVVREPAWQVVTGRRRAAQSQGVAAKREVIESARVMASPQVGGARNGAEERQKKGVGRQHNE